MKPFPLDTIAPEDTAVELKLRSQENRRRRLATAYGAIIPVLSNAGPPRRPRPVATGLR